MKFTVSTKPLKEGLNLCVVESNVSKYYPMSRLIQITVTNDMLRINTDSPLILTELRYKGIGVGETKSIIVDSICFKKLISTITASYVELEITDCLVIRAGKSSFNIPKYIDVSEVSLATPKDINADNDDIIGSISKSDWKFIKDHQMFARGTSISNVVYTYVWIGESGDVLVGDLTNGLFTHSNIEGIGKTCLFSDTIINLFYTLPDNTNIIPCEDNYLVTFKTDSYDYVSEISPKYESDDNGYYLAEDIINMMGVDSAHMLMVNVADINTALNQAQLLSDSKNATVIWDVHSGSITIKDHNINCVIPAEGDQSDDYSLVFNLAILKAVISNCSEQTIGITPTYNSDDLVNSEAVGITIVSGDLTMVVAGEEQ